MSNPWKGETLKRGVYWAAATKNGFPVAYAVDSNGDEVNRIELDTKSWTDGEIAVEWLWGYLDRVDAIPGSIRGGPQRGHLQLVCWEAIP